jgi:putative ABC transport system substrate-binding protein
MNRRMFITVLGGATAWPLAARAQQRTLPVVGFLDTATADERLSLVTSFRQGLAETGYVEGQNVVIEYRWAEGHYDRLPELAADLVRRQVSVIATPGTTAAGTAAKSGTTTIPIVFFAASDPVKLGLVASLNRPGGNATGVNSFSSELVGKRLELLRAMVPALVRVAALVNPIDGANAELIARDLQESGSALGMQIQFLNASTGREIDAAFATLVRERAGALFVSPGSLFNSRRAQLVVLAARHAVPTIFSSPEYAEAGGLMSYGSDTRDAFRQVGVYTGRILKGAKPAELPVVQPTKLELVINLNTANALGLTIPSNLLALADEVIE